MVENKTGSSPGVVTIDYPIILIPTEQQKGLLEARWGQDPAMRTQFQTDKEVYISAVSVHIEGIGDVKYANKKEKPMGDIRSIEVYKSRDGKYHASLRCLVRRPQELPLAKDYGLEVPDDGYAIAEDGTFCVGEKYQAQAIARLADLQYKMAAKAKGRDNWNHIQKLVKKAAKHIKDQRKTHKAQLLAAERKAGHVSGASQNGGGATKNEATARPKPPASNRNAGAGTQGKAKPRPADKVDNEPTIASLIRETPQVSAKRQGKGKKGKRTYPVSAPEQHRRNLQRKQDDSIRDMMCADCMMDPSCPGWRRAQYCPLM